MNVLIACEFSGIVRDAFIKKGHNAFSCDLLDTELPGPHFKDDVLNHLQDGFDLMIAHPPCTYHCNSGVCWLHKKPGRWLELEKSILFFKKLLSCNIPKICIENPIPHKYSKREIGNYSQIIQPYEFGHLERKSTCLWLKNLPKLQETNNVYNEMKKLPKNISQRIHYLPPQKDRWKKRSITFQGIADAMAEQWGSL